MSSISAFYRLGLLGQLETSLEVGSALRLDPALQTIPQPLFHTWMAVVSLAGRNADGLTWATRETIGEYRAQWATRGNSVAAISRHLGHLEEEGLILRFREMGLHWRQGHPVTVTYTVLLLPQGPFRQALSQEGRELVHGCHGGPSRAGSRASFPGPRYNPSCPELGHRPVYFDSLVPINVRRACKAAIAQGPPPIALLATHSGRLVTRQYPIHQSGEREEEEGRFRADAAMSPKPGAVDFELNDGEGLEQDLSTPTVGGDSTFALQALCAHRRPQGGTQGSLLVGDGDAA